MIFIYVSRDNKVQNAHWKGEYIWRARITKENWLIRKNIEMEIPLILIRPFENYASIFFFNISYRKPNMIFKVHVTYLKGMS